MSVHEARKALERLRMLAFGNDFANEGEIRRDYELVSETLDLVELLDHDCAAATVVRGNDTKGVTK